MSDQKPNTAKIADTPKSDSSHHDGDYKGEPLDEKLRDGPIEHRGCTDCICCLSFLLFLIAWFACGIYGFANGDPYLLTYLYDSDENACGRPDEDAEDYPYLYFPFPIPGYLKYRVCVKDCPESYDDEVECYKNNYFKDNCQFRWEEVFDDPHEVYGYLKGYYPSDGYIKRVCLPDLSDDDERGWLSSAYDEVVDFIDVNTMQKWFGDVVTCWPTFFIVAGIALVIAAFYLLLLRYCIGVMVWLSIFTILGLLVAFGIVCHVSAYYVFDGASDDDTQTTLYVIAIIFYCASGVFLIYILCMCNRIRLAIAIMKSGTIYIKDVWQVLMVPPVMFVLTLGIYIYWVFAVVFLYATGDVKQDDNDALAEVEWDESTRKVYYFEFFGIFWVAAFLIALEQFIIAGSVCIWYYSHKSDSGPQRPVS